jgi:anti-anti-sigma factor
MDLRVTSSTIGTARVVAFDGVADLSAVPALHAALTRATTDLDEVGSMVIDLDGLTLLDDVAIGLLVGAAERSRRAGVELVLVCTNDRVRERLRSTRVDRIVPVTTSIASATGDRARSAWTPSGSSATS